MSYVIDMNKTLELTLNIDNIIKVINNADGDSERFAEVLRYHRIPHLSYTKVTTVEFCKYRYFLQYVRMIDPTPTPEYFTKGKLLHKLIALSYKNSRRNRATPKKDYLNLIKKQYAQGESYMHLLNGLTIHLDNLWKDCQILEIEEPFVMEVSNDLPPCVGVIDLILKRGREFIIVDHKTGRNFYPKDELQMGIYVEYIKRKYGKGRFSFYYDSYRWVNNLDRIRKPAFERTPVSIQENYWTSAMERIQRAYKHIKAIEQSERSVRQGECFRCPYRNYCYE